jgi:hypothetical protein
VSAHPGRHSDGECVEHLAKRLANQFQPIERTNSSQDVARVGALPTVGFEQTQPLEALQHQIEEHSFGIAIDQATPKFTQDRVIESWIVEVQSERVLPIDPNTHGIGSLAVDRSSTNWNMVISGRRHGRSAG